MLTLEKNNTALNTDSDFSVQIEDKSQFTNFKEIEGSKSIGIEIPNNDPNRMHLNNPDRFEKMGEQDDHKFESYMLRHYGQPIMPGTLIIEETTDEAFSGWLRDIIGDIAERMKGKYINQSNLSGEKTFENKETYDPDIDDYCCPRIFNRHFWRDRGKNMENSAEIVDLEGNTFEKKESVGKLTLQFLQGEQYFVNKPRVGGVVSNGTDNAPVVSPFLFLWKAVELILFDLKIQVTDNFLKTDNDLKRLAIYHTWNIAQQIFTTEDKTIYPTNLNDPSDTLPFATEIINAVSWETDKFYYKDLLPKMKIGDFILGIQNKLNVVFDWNGLDEIRIIDREAVLLADAFDLEEYAVGIWNNGTRKNLCIKLSSENDDADAAFSDNWQDLSDLRQYIKEPVLQRTDLKLLTPELDEIRLVTGENKYYQYHWFTPEAETSDGTVQQEDILDWEDVSICFQPYFFNDGDREIEEISSSFGSLRQSDKGYLLVQQQGNSQAFKTQFTTFSPRLFFYLGDENASFQTSNLSLDYAGDNGLVAQRWKYTLPFLANALPSKRKFKMPSSVYYYVRQNRNKMPFRTREGSFIIENIKATLGRPEMIEVELEVLKREDNFWETTTGNTDGGGGVPTPAFVPKYIGITLDGKPYVIPEGGESPKYPMVWSALSPSKNAAQWCVDYSPTDKLLFVGCAGGILSIFDFTDVKNILVKTIKVLPSGEICSVTLVNGRIVIGKAGGKFAYEQPYYSNIMSYVDNQGADTGPYDSAIAGCLNHIVYCDGVYYGFTDRGEINISTNLRGWEQTMDWVTCFNRAVVTDTKIWALSDNDRQFWKLRSSGPHGSWTEWDISGTSDPTIIDALAISGDMFGCVIDEDFKGLRVVMDPENNNNMFSPLMAQKTRSACYSGGKLVLSIKHYSGSAMLAISNPPPQVPGWTYVAMPYLMQKLFNY